MHEFSIALRVMEIAEEEVRNAGGGKINGLNLEVGELSGVMTDALEYAFLTLAEGKNMGDLRVNIEKITAMARCRNCGREYVVKQFYETCPDCGAEQPEIVSGRELRLKSVAMV